MKLTILRDLKPLSLLPSMDNRDLSSMLGLGCVRPKDKSDADSVYRKYHTINHQTIILPKI